MGEGLMPAIPLSYSLRNMLTRRLTTALTAGGMGLVVFVFCAVLMMAKGLEQTLVDTGSPDNVVAIRKGSTTEVQSGVDRSQAALLEVQPEVARDGRGNALAAKELVVVISLPKRDGSGDSYVTLRGIGPQSPALRPQVRLVAGRMPRPGAAEAAAGAKIAAGFTGCGLGEHFRFAARDWLVVGVFAAGSTGFASEMWTDADLLMASARRGAYSSTLLRLADPTAFPALKDRLESDPRLTVEVQREPKYYLAQSEMMATFLRILGLSLTAIFSLGAIVGALITMHSAVANRVGEIGTLRALGFQRRHILLAFLLESLSLGLLGWVLGATAASCLQLVTVSTMNFQTFAELAFSFTLTPAILLQSLAFALGMGLAGGLLPALKAVRLKVVDALRTA
jgi:ABC-type lipoprotein release transport system permease subunit